MFSGGNYGHGGGYQWRRAGATPSLPAFGTSSSASSAAREFGRFRPSSSASFTSATLPMRSSGFTSSTSSAFPSAFGANSAGTSPWRTGSYKSVLFSPMSGSSRYSGTGTGGTGMSSSYHQDWSSSSPRPTYGSGLSSGYTPQRYPSSDRLNRFSSAQHGSSSNIGLGLSSSRYSPSPASNTLSFGAAPLRSSSFASSVGLGEGLRTSGSSSNLAGYTPSRRAYGGGTSYASACGSGSSSLMSSSLYGSSSHFQPTARVPSYSSALDRASVGRDFGSSQRSSGNLPSPLASAGFSSSSRRSVGHSSPVDSCAERGRKSPALEAALAGNNSDEEGKKEEKKPLKEEKPLEKLSPKKKHEEPNLTNLEESVPSKKSSEEPTAEEPTAKRSARPKIVTPEAEPVDLPPSKSQSPSSVTKSHSPDEGQRRSTPSISVTPSPRTSKSKSPSPRPNEAEKQQKLSNSVDKLDEKKKQLWSGGGGNSPQKVEFPPAFGQKSAFSQLEKMIKLTAFDQQKFQRQVRVATGQEVEEEKPMVEEKQVESPADESKLRSRKVGGRKSVSRSPSPCPLAGEAAECEGKRRSGRRKSTASRSSSPCPQGKGEELGERPKSERRKSSRSPSPCPQKGKEEGSEKRRKSVSRSPSPRPRDKAAYANDGGPNVERRSLSPAPESLDPGKRATRRRRTVENLMDELKSVLGGGGGAEQNGDGKSRSRSKSRQKEAEEEAQKGTRLRPPLLLVTSPSMGDPEEEIEAEEEEVEEMKPNQEGNSAKLTLKLTAAAGEEENEGSDEDEEEEDFSDEDYSDEEYTDEDEEEWESDWDVDEATVCRTLQISGLSGGYESDFELPFELDKAKEKGRLPEANALPPPIFTASISYDGMSDSWGTSAGRTTYSDEGTGSWTAYSGPGEDVEVGFTLVQRAAMRGSEEDEEFTTSSSGSYTSGTYSTSGSSFDEDEEAESGEEVDDQQRSCTRSRSLDDRSISRSHRSSTSSSSSSSSGEEALSVQSGAGDEPMEVEKPKLDEPKLVVLMPTEEEEVELPELLESADHLVQVEVMEMGEPEELEEEGNEEEDKAVLREATFVREQRQKVDVESANFLPGQAKPKTDFAKKAVVQAMREEKAKVAQETKAIQAPSEEEIRKRKEREEEEERAKKRKEEEERKRKKAEEEKRKKEEEDERKKRAEEKRKEKEQVDKSAQRKSTLNMRAEEKAKAEQQEQERAREQARATGTVGKARGRYQPSEPIIPVLTTNEPIVYKRSSRLEPKPVDEARQKRVYSPIPKPEPDDQFDKQMAELRDQMKKGSRKLQSEFRDVSSGLKSATTEAKQKAKEEEHKLVMNKASSVFGRAEGEKKRQKELLAETEGQKKGMEKMEEKEGLKEKPKVEEVVAKRPEPKKTIRRAAKEPKQQQEEADKKQEEAGTKHVPRRFGDKPEGKRKTEELMKFTKEETPAPPPAALQKVAEEAQKPEALEQQQKAMVEAPKRSGKGRRAARRRSTRRGHRRRTFIRTPVDIDELMGWRGMDSFEKMDAFFSSKGAEKRQMKEDIAGGPATKRRGIEAQKVWISELHDIDKLYKASELRDIKMSAGA